MLDRVLTIPPYEIKKKTQNKNLFLIYIIKSNKVSAILRATFILLHTKVNLFGIITEYDKISRFMRMAFTLDILKFIQRERSNFDEFNKIWIRNTDWINYTNFVTRKYILMIRNKCLCDFWKTVFYFALSAVQLHVGMLTMITCVWDYMRLS